MSTTEGGERTRNIESELEEKFRDIRRLNRRALLESRKCEYSIDLRDSYAYRSVVYEYAVVMRDYERGLYESRVDFEKAIELLDRPTDGLEDILKRLQRDPCKV